MTSIICLKVFWERYSITVQGRVDATRYTPYFRESRISLTWLIKVRECVKAKWWRRDESGRVRPCEQHDTGAFRADMMQLPGEAVALPDIQIVSSSLA